MKTLFVTATGTECGKTWVTRGLARGLSARGLRVAALKPVETGVSGRPIDADALARAAGRRQDADVSGFFRCERPLSPLAASLMGAPACPSPNALAQHCRTASSWAQLALVEGAGGIKVPLDGAYTNADLVRELGGPFLLVAPNALGTLSHVLTALDSARVESLRPAAIVLSDAFAREGDPSVATNARILRDKTGLDVFVMPTAADDDDALAAATASCGLLDRVEAFARR